MVQIPVPQPTSNTFYNLVSQYDINPYFDIFYMWAFGDRCYV